MKFERMEAGRDTRCKSRRKERKHYGIQGKRVGEKKGRNPEIKYVFFLVIMFTHMPRLSIK